MEHVIAADRQAVAIASYQPNVEIRIGKLNTCCHSWCTAVDRVKAIGLHIIREAA